MLENPPRLNVQRLALRFEPRQRRLERLARRDTLELERDAAPHDRSAQRHCRRPRVGRRSLASGAVAASFTILSGREAAER